MNLYSMKVTMEVTVIADYIEAETAIEAENQVRADIANAGFEQVHAVSISHLKLMETQHDLS